MLKLCLFTAIVVMLGSLSLLGAEIITIGTGTSSQRYPFGPYYGYERSASLYSETEIGFTGTITHLAWFCSSISGAYIPTKIYLKTSTDVFLTSTTWADMISGATLVYNESREFYTIGWLEIDIADFEYEGDNLLVLCETNVGGYGYYHFSSYRYTDTSVHTHQMWYANQNPPLGNGETWINRPNIQITLTPSDVVDDPLNLKLDSYFSSQVYSNWVPNASNDIVMLAYSQSGFGTPENNVTYNVGDNLAGGGQIVYIGDGIEFFHNGLEPLTIYEYKAWSVRLSTGSPTYSPGITRSVITTHPPVSFFPQQEDFELGEIPNRWKKTVPAENDIIVSNLQNHTPGGSHSIRFSSQNQASNYHQYLYSPEYTVTSDNLRVSFYQRKHDDSAETLEVGVIRPDQPVCLNMVSVPLGYDGWQHVEFGVPQHVGQNIRIAWHYYGNNQMHAYLDDFLIEQVTSPPPLQISPPRWEYGATVLGTSLIKEFTFFPSGGGTLDLTGIEIGNDNFEILNPPPFPVTVSEDNPLALNVSYAPQSVGTHSSAIIVRDEYANFYLAEITGSGYVRPPGSTCQNALEVGFPLVAYSNNTAAYGNDYSSNHFSPPNEYMNGNDFVMSFDITQNSFLHGSISGPNTGMVITNQVPDIEIPAEVKTFVGGPEGGSFTNLALRPGTYYAIVSSLPEPQSADFVVSLNTSPASSNPLLIQNFYSVDFGVRPVNLSSPSQRLSFKNLGGGLVVIDPPVQLSGENPEDFEVIDLNSYPINLEFGDVVNIDASFPPTEAGERIAQLLVTYSYQTRDNEDQRSVRTIELSGWGLGSPIATISSGTDSVVISWDAVPGATAYRVYFTDDPDTWDDQQYQSASTNSITVPAGLRRFFRISALMD